MTDRLATRHMDVLVGLRRWARGSVTDEAAVELLASLGGRFSSTARPWVRDCIRSGWYWLDPDPFGSYASRLTPHQQHVIDLIVALLNGEPLGRPAARPAPVESRRAA